MIPAIEKPDVQNICIGAELNGRFWPKADIETESKWVFLNVRFGEKSSRSGRLYARNLPQPVYSSEET